VTWRFSRLFGAAALAGTAIALLGAAAPTPTSPPPTPRFSEEVSVREASVIVDPPDRLQNKRPRPGDFLVQVDGRSMRVIRAERLSEDDVWDLVVYVDRVLAKPDTAFPALLALAQKTEDFTRLGRVAVVVADPSPRLVLAPTREALRVRDVLADLAGEARVARQREAGRPQTGTAPSLAADDLRRQLDRLVTQLAGQTSAGPHALLLVTDPVQASATGTIGTIGTTGTTALLGETSRLLSSYGWVTFALPFRSIDEDPGPRDPGTSDIERLRTGAGAGSSHSSGVPPVIPMRPPKPSAIQIPGVIELYLSPDLAALRSLVQPTTGTVVGYPEQLGFVVSRLENRWRIWYEPLEETDGRAHALAVSLVRNGEPVRAQSWLRSSTPEGITEARLRLLLGGGEPQAGNLSATVAGEVTGDAVTLHVQATPLPATEPGSKATGPVRISYAFAQTGGAIEIRHELVPGTADPGKGWSRDSRAVLPPGTVRVAVAVEDLARELWSARLLEVPAHVQDQVHRSAGGDADRP
jgi:hypothetical protein